MEDKLTNLEPEDLETLAGGDWNPLKQCPKCGNFDIHEVETGDDGEVSMGCYNCGFGYTVYKDGHYAPGVIY